MAPKYIWDPGKMEEQRQLIMAEAGMIDPADVPWIEGDGSWHNGSSGLTAAWMSRSFRKTGVSCRRLQAGLTRPCWKPR
jgi:hypothetical protein